MKFSNRKFHVGDYIQGVFIMNSTFCFITDFNHDFAVACMEGLILKSIANARIVHVDHSIEKFCVASAAFVLNSSYTYFPDNTIFIAIVDPGVGSKRETLCIETDRYQFIGPNNGIFHYILKNNPNARIWHINEEIIVATSNTFHGRDLFTPAAIHLAQNKRDFLTPALLKNIVYLPQLKDYLVIYVDSFGNVKTNVPANQNQALSHINLIINDQSHRLPWVKTFSQAPAGQLIAYCGSNNTMEFAVNLGSAAKQLQVRPGQLIRIDSCI